MLGVFFSYDACGLKQIAHCSATVNNQTGKQSAAAMTEEEAAQVEEASQYLAGMEAVLAMLSEEQVDALLEMEALQPGLKMWIVSLYGDTIQ